jgi:hypothetical protein
VCSGTDSCSTGEKGGGGGGTVFCGGGVGRGCGCGFRSRDGGGGGGEVERGEERWRGGGGVLRGMETRGSRGVRWKWRGREERERMTRNMNRQAAPAPSAHDDHQCYWAVANIRDTLKLNDTCLSVLDLSPLFHTLGPVPNKSLSLSLPLSLSSRLPYVRVVEHSILCKEKTASKIFTYRGKGYRHAQTLTRAGRS